jgi:hypothetical protein
MRLHAYEWLHRGLAANPATPDLPLVIVDISKLQPVRDRETGVDGGPAYTPRPALQQILEQVMSCGRPGGGGAVAIGFDLDFSPETNGYVIAPRQTYPFFDACLRATQAGLPVYLGVRRLETFGPRAWLGGEEYAPLAVDISRPHSPVLRMPYEYEFGADERPLPTLSRALASAYLTNPRVRLQSPPGWLAWAAHPVTEISPLADIKTFRVSSYLVDFSLRRQVAAGAIDYLELTNAQPEALAARVSGKMVLIGDAASSHSQDTVSIPTEAEPIPGLFVHACGALTLAQSQIWELDHVLGVALTVALAFASIILIHATCNRFCDYGDVSPVAMNVLLTFGLTALLLGITWSLARFSRVMWLDAFAICLILLVHCMTEVFLASVNWYWLRTHRSNRLAALVVRRESEDKS